MAMENLSMEVLIGTSLLSGPFSIAMFDYQKWCPYFRKTSIVHQWTQSMEGTSMIDPVIHMDIDVHPVPSFS